jgi:hypothetical protein
MRPTTWPRQRRSIRSINLNANDDKPHWVQEGDWLCTLQFLPSDDFEQRSFDIDDLGHLLGYALLTDTRVLALLGDPAAEAYEILFSFCSPELKLRFLELIRADENMGAAYIHDEFSVPTIDEVQKALPLSMVLPKDVVQEVTVIATTLIAGAHDQWAS